MQFVPDVYNQQLSFYDLDTDRGVSYEDPLTALAEDAVHSRLGLRDTLPDFGDIPRLFRADVIATIIRDATQDYSTTVFDQKQVDDLDRLLFIGGEVSLFGLQVDVSPLLGTLTSEVPATITTTDMLAAVDSATGVNPFDNLIDPVDKSKNSRSIIGRLILAQNVQKPSGLVDYNAAFLLADHYKETGQMVLGTNDQFVMDGDVDRGLPLFWQLLIHESDQTPLSQKGLDGTAGIEGFVAYFDDGSKRTESFDAQRGIARIVYETNGTQMPSESTTNSVGPVLSICAGYENSTDIPYLPKWMKDSEFADLPATLLLDVYNDRYVMTVRY